MDCLTFYRLDGTILYSGWFDESGRNLDEPLTWDHVDCLVTKEFHKKEWLKAVAAGLTTDCRTACHRAAIALPVRSAPWARPS